MKISKIIYRKYIIWLPLAIIFCNYFFLVAKFAGISTDNIDYFTDFQDIKLPEIDFMDIIFQYGSNPDFIIKFVTKGRGINFKH